MAKNRASSPKPNKRRGEVPVTRCVPDRYLALIALLSEQQKEWVKEFGFNTLMYMHNFQVDRKLAFWLMERYDGVKRTLEIRRDCRLNVYANDVGWVLGIPNGGLMVPTHCDNKKLYKEYCEKFENYNGIDCNFLLKLVKENGGMERNDFKIIFLLYTIGTFLAPNQSWKISPKNLKTVLSIKDPRNYNWCSFVLNDLREASVRFQCGRKKAAKKVEALGGELSMGSGGFGGCIIFLMLFYFDRLDLGEPINWGKNARITAWTKELIERAKHSDKKVEDVGEERFVSFGNCKLLDMQKFCYGLRHPLESEGVLFRESGSTEPLPCLATNVTLDASKRKRRYIAKPQKPKGQPKLSVPLPKNPKKKYVRKIEKFRTKAMSTDRDAENSLSTKSKGWEKSSEHRQDSELAEDDSDCEHDVGNHRANSGEGQENVEKHGEESNGDDASSGDNGSHTSDEFFSCSSRSSIGLDMSFASDRDEEHVSLQRQQESTTPNDQVKILTEAREMETMVDLRPQKRRKNAEAHDDIADEVDHISNLEDTLLCHILSFIPTKYAVRTSVLSQRWKHIWTKTAVLDFFQCWDVQGEKDKFASGVTKILLLNSISCLKKLCFDHLLEFDGGHVDAWLANLLKREIEEVNLYNRLCHQPFDRPVMVFAQVRPVILRLSGGSIRELPVSIKLPNLKILHLTDLESLNCNINRLLAGCPILEELEIYNCRWFSVEIKSSALKRLAVCYPSSFIDESHDLNVKTPNLEHLSLSCFKACKGLWHFDQMKCLMKGRICLRSLPLPMLRLISGATTLYLCNYQLSDPAIDALCHDQISFSRLTYLELEVVNDAFLIMPSVLKCSPNLVSFVFIKGMPPLGRKSTSARPEGKWKNPSVKLECLSSCLKVVGISYFEQCKDYLDMVGYFLKNAKVLTELRLAMYKLDGDKESSILRKLSFLPRASVTCQVKIC